MKSSENKSINSNVINKNPRGYTMYRSISVTVRNIFYYYYLIFYVIFIIIFEFYVLRMYQRLERLHCNYMRINL